MSTGLILDGAVGHDDLVDGQTIYWSSFCAEQDGISIPAYVEQHWDQLKNNILGWLEHFSQLKVNDKSLEEHCMLGNGFSMHWSSLVNEKSYLKSPSIYLAIRMLALKDLLLSQAITKIELRTTCRQLKHFIQLLAKELGIDFRCRLRRKPYQINIGHLPRACYNRLPFVLKAAAVYLRIIWQYRWFLICPVKTDCDKKKSITIVTPFPGFDVGLAKKGVFRSVWWSSLHDLIQEEHLNVDWLMMYYHNNQFTLSESRALLESFNQLSSNQSYRFIYNAINVSLLMRMVQLYTKMTIRYRAIQKALTLQLPATNNAWLYQVLQSDFVDSMIGATAVLNIFHYFCFKKNIRNRQASSLCLFLFENQGWEKCLTFHWKQMTRSPIVGFVHASLRPLDLRYAGMDKKYESPECVSLPTQVAVHGEDAIVNLSQLKFPSPYLRHVEAVRFMYLSQVLHGRDVSLGDDLKILFITGQDLVITTYQCSLVKAMLEAYGEQMSLQLIIKPHPLMRSPIQFFAKHCKGISYQLSNMPLQEVLLEGVNLAILENSTTAALELLYMQVPFCLIKYPGRLNLSPLVRFPRLFISTSDDLYNCIKNIKSVLAYIKEIMVDNPSLFWLDPSLPRWRNLLLEAV